MQTTKGGFDGTTQETVTVETVMEVASAVIVAGVASVAIVATVAGVASAVTAAPLRIHLEVVEAWVGEWVVAVGTAVMLPQAGAPPRAVATNGTTSALAAVRVAEAVGAEAHRLLGPAGGLVL
mmetsp:Transcript_4574/g.8693  ORF Transcript_4574/g.8693 Transcript_4574/m.8693 type:complete len:123 (+) Transcript_4574:163-531(+)